MDKTEKQSIGKKQFFILLVFFLMAIYSINIYLLWGYPIDDAYISLRYARNLAAGNGLVYNPGEQVEGYTNFSWVILESLIIFMDGDPELWIRIIGAAVGITIWFLMLMWGKQWFGNYSFFAVLPVAYLSTNGYFIRYSLSGMETNFYGLLILLGIYFISQKPNGSGTLFSTLCFLGASLTRPEGFLFSVAVLLWQLYLCHGKKIKRSQLLMNIIIYVIPFVIYTLWRFAYFGSFLPNTYYVRMGKGLSDYVYTVKNGGLYIEAFFKVHYWLPLISLVSVLSYKKYKGILISGVFAIIFCMVIILEGGDWMPFFRMLVPVIPLFFLLLAAATENIPAWIRLNSFRWSKVVMVIIHIGFILLISMSWWPVPQNFSLLKNSFMMSAGKRYHAFRDLNRIIQQDIGTGKWIHDYAPDGLTLAVTSAGVVPYYSQLKVYDCLGLTDTYIARTNLKKNRMSSMEKPDGKKKLVIPLSMPAHEKTDIMYILNKKPDIFMDGDPDMLQEAGYHIYYFPGSNIVYWAKSPVRWKYGPNM